MKTLSFKTLAITSGLVSLTAFHGASAVAGEDPNYTPSYVSTTTREQVRAEYLEAVKDGSLPIYNEAISGEPLIAKASPSTFTREQVHAEYLQAVKDDRLAAIEHEGISGGYLIGNAPPSTLSREAVYAETIEWLRANQADVQMGGK